MNDPKVLANKAGKTYYEYITSPAPGDYIPTEREQEFIYQIVEHGKSAPQAHLEAGYAQSTAKDAHVRERRLAPHIFKATRARLSAGVPLALRVLIDIADDSQVAPSVRLKAATELLDRGGLPKTIEVDFGGETKALEELSRDELKTQIHNRLKHLKKMDPKTAVIDVTPEEASVG